jgi:hypothetical protein
MSNTILDPRKVRSGHHGEMYDGEGVFLAEMPKFQAIINVNNSDYQGAGTLIVAAILQGVTITLSTTETHVKDARLYSILAALKRGEQQELHFQGIIRGADGNDGRYVLRHCVPDGNIDLFNIQPGQILERAVNYRVNELPDIQALL